jgi:fructan beta-fructosidase
MRIACQKLIKTEVKSKLCMVLLLSFSFFSLVAQDIEMKITGSYLNIPVGKDVRAKMMQLVVNGKLQREFAVQLAEDTVSYWVYADVSAYKGQKLKINYDGSSKAMNRIYQDDKINGADSLYKESNRPQFHFTVKKRLEQ